MLLDHICGRVGVTAVAGVALVVIGIGVTGRTRTIGATAVVHREVVVLKDCPRPAARAVTRITVVAELALMGINVAAHAGFRRALVDIIDMALRTDHLHVGTVEWEGGLAVVKGRALPTVGGVTRRAVGAELAEMLLRIGVTVYARFGRALVDVITVTARAGGFDVSTR